LWLEASASNILGGSSESMRDGSFGVNARSSRSPEWQHGALAALYLGGLANLGGGA
jgi:hypothetical protein